MLPQAHPKRKEKKNNEMNIPLPPVDRLPKLPKIQLQIKVKTKKKHLNSGANRKKYINIGQYVFKPYQFKILNFTKCYAVFCLWNNA